MTKEQMREAIIHRANGGFLDSDVMSRFHPVVVDIWIQMAINTILNATARKMDDHELDIYTREVTDITVLKDSDGRYYCVLPKKYVQLPRNMGIRYVRDNATDNNNKVRHYTPSTVSAERVFDDLEVNSVMDEPTVIVHGNTLYFKDFDDEMGKVAVGIIQAWESYGEGDEFHIPAGNEMMFVESVFNLVAGTKPADESNDNVSN